MAGEISGLRDLKSQIYLIERTSVLQKDIQDFLKAGNDILNSVSSAIDRNDYSTLHSDVARVVKSVSVERKTTYSSQRQQQGRQVNAGSRQPKFRPFFQKRVSKYLGVPEMTFSACIGFFDLVFLLGISATGSVPGIVVSALILAGCAALFVRGLNKFKLSKSFYQYGNILKDAEYFNITDLAKAALKTDKEVLKDIKNMIKEGFLPRARLDRTEKTCMITDRAYEQYLGAEQDREAREAREKASEEARIEEAKRQNAEYANLPTGAVKVLEEGREYVDFVRAINDRIPDKVLSDKLDRLENIMNRIFAQVKKDPSSAEDLRKLMNYYLPTTKKLLNAYVELDKEPEVGDNILKTKKEIEGAMDTINTAFESLLDSLFQDMAWDISSDISVMKTMMAQDGLTVEGRGISSQMASQSQTQAKEL